MSESADGEMVESVINRMAEARLVILGEDTVEVAHEALISAWPRLQEWLGEDREGLRIHRQLADAAQEWNRLSRDPGALVHRGLRLAAAREWAGRHGMDLNSLELAYLQAARALERSELEAVRRRNRRLRELVAGLTILFLLALIVGAAAVQQRQAADEQRRLAISRRVAAQTVAGDRITRRHGRPRRDDATGRLKSRRHPRG